MDFDYQEAVPRLAGRLRQLRVHRRISQRQLADSAGVAPSLVCQIERGRRDAQLSTWAKLFQGLGYQLLFDETELCEEADDLLIEEADRRAERRWEGLCTGKRRF